MGSSNQNCGDGCDCPPRTAGPNSTISKLFLYVKAKCFSAVDVGLNIVHALYKIADAITALKEGPVQTVTGDFHFQVDGWEDIEAGDSIAVDAFVVTHNFDVLSVGASYIPQRMQTSGGIYANGDKLIVRVFDFTAGAQIGPDLVLSLISFNANNHAAGVPIGQIGLGHKIGVMMEFQSASPGTHIEAFPVDVFLFVKPKELNIP